jgi:hypothetical protein
MNLEQKRKQQQAQHCCLGQEPMIQGVKTAVDEERDTRLLVVNWASVQQSKWKVKMVFDHSLDEPW